MAKLYQALNHTPHNGQSSSNLLRAVPFAINCGPKKLETLNFFYIVTIQRKGFALITEKDASISNGHAHITFLRFTVY